jgi:hypothetical protein
MDATSKTGFEPNGRCLRTGNNGATMNCMVCKDLSRVLESADMDYRVALAAPFYLVSTEIAAKMQVDMERAKIAVSEHKSSCLLVNEDVFLMA